MPEPALEVRLRHRLGTLQIDVEFVTNAPWCVLFGPSGSGKSTILRAIAGMFRPDDGRIVVGGKVVFDSAAGIWVQPHRRPVRWAAQRAMLYPWKKVKWHLPMGMSIQEDRFATRGGMDEIERASEHFGLSAIMDLKPGELSGGERQMVGVARAAAGVNGHCLLLDEPFTGMDAAIRDGLMRNLRTWIGASPVLSVTHDVGEAFLLEAEVVRISRGLVVAQGPVERVLAEERSRLLRLLR